MDLVFMLTYNCNLRCKYCDIRKRADDMSFEIVKKSIDFFTINDLHVESVRFFWWEPLLKKNIISEFVRGFQDNQICNRFFLTTNGILLDDTILSFLRENNFDLNVSIDWEDITMQENRCTENWNSPYVIIYGNAEKCIDFSWINQVITPQKSKELYKNFLFLYDMWVRKFNFLPEYFCEWSKDSLKNLYIWFNQIVHFVLNWHPISIKNDWKNDASQLFLFGLVVDTNGDIYGTRLILSSVFEKYKQILKIWNVVDWFSIDIHSKIWQEGYEKIFMDIFREEIPPLVLKSLGYIDKISSTYFQKMNLYLDSLKSMDNYTKTIICVENPKNSHMIGTGFNVYGYIPWNGKLMSDIKTNPFILLDYNHPWLISPQWEKYLSTWFHPHRGFETMSLVYEWQIEHYDTAGDWGIVCSGDVEWMTAWNGVVHNEWITKEFSWKGWIQHMVHLWINLPAKYKLEPLKYQNIKAKNIPTWETDGIIVRIIAGDFIFPSKNWKSISKKWIVNTYTPIEIYDIRFSNNWKLDIQLPEWYVTLVLVTKWEIFLNEKKLVFGDMATLSSLGTNFSIIWTPLTNVLIMSWEPINEPIVHNKTFVMNTEDEIIQAFKDFNDWRMWVVTV